MIITVGFESWIDTGFGEKIPYYLAHGINTPNISCFEKVWFAGKLKQVFSQNLLRLEFNVTVVNTVSVFGRFG